ncbi:MAG: transglutaminase-like putative cysteine protease [Planctomycetota bacterium]|jgi:transglutaminase-like putative cysteine protease
MRGYSEWTGQRQYFQACGGMNNSNLQLRAAPAFSIGATLLVWGWQCQFLPFALLMAVLLEMAQFMSWRWSITDKEFNTLSDFSGVVFFIVVIYIFTDEGARGIFVILSVMPFVLFPLLITQKYSERGMMNLSALLPGLRKLEPALSPQAGTITDISLPYFIVCLVSASAGNQRTIGFFIVISLLIALMLWSVRPKRYSIRLWFVAIVLSLSMAYAVQIGLRQLQASLEASFIGIFDQFMWRYRDPNRATTAIGSLGRLKLSDRIVLRVKAEDMPEIPLLLKEASYSNFGHGVWSSQESDFSVIDQNSDGSWTLTNEIQSDLELTIATYMVRDKGVIPLPHGTSKIKNVTAIEIQKNPLGTVIMDIREGWIQYDVAYENIIHDELPPNENDLLLLNYYREDFERLANELQLSSMTTEQVVDTVSRFFQENFTYTLNQSQRYPKGKYLANFLFNNRQGHCEYFATATALLLRSVGIPTRYAVGYSVDEYSALEGQYIARARDAHSWTQVYINDHWEVLDTTPAIWSSYEEQNASAVEPFMDIWFWASYTWSRWQSDDLTEEEQNTDVLMWLLIPLIAMLAWRIYFKERIQNKPERAGIDEQGAYPGDDSSFYELVSVMESSCSPRFPGETLPAWFNRIDSRIHAQYLHAALEMHYQYRFDPAGISLLEQKKLNQLVADLLTTEKEWLTSPD